MNRNLSGITGHIVSFLGAVLTIFVLSIIVRGPYWGYSQCLAIFLLFTLPVTFIMYAGGKGPFWQKINVIDWFFVGISILSLGYLIVNAEHILTRVEYISYIPPFEFTMGILAIISVIEATRRAIGSAMAIISLVLLIYIAYGGILPVPFGHSGYDWYWIIDTLYLTSKGIFGTPLWVVMSLAFPFILYGVILQELGVLRTFLDFANRLLGRTPGAPAKTTIIAGTLVGMGSGLPMSTTYLIGFSTIPEMKRVGYPGQVAGAIAAVVGTAAQLMPPMLGVAAFVVAQYMGVPYIKVCQYTLLPALMFYFVFYCTINFETYKFNVKIHEIVTQSYGTILARGFYIFIISIVVLLVFLIMFYPVGLSALYACTTALALGLLRRHNRLNLRMFYAILATTGRTAVYIAIACSAAGIIIGLLVETGLSLKFANIVAVTGQNYLIVALFLSALSILVLSMGMPSIPAYITAIAIFGPALMNLGVIPVVAHIFCFYYATLYSITPPVALASYAGAQIAGEDPMKTSLVACRLGIMAYVIPFLFAYNPALLLVAEYWNVWQVLRLIFLYIPGLILFAAGLSRFWTRKMDWKDTIVAMAGGIMMLIPSVVIQLIGVVGFIYTFYRQDIFSAYLRRRPANA